MLIVSAMSMRGICLADVDRVRSVAALRVMPGCCVSGMSNMSGVLVVIRRRYDSSRPRAFVGVAVVVMAVVVLTVLVLH